MARFLYFLLLLYLMRMLWSAVAAWLGEQAKRQMNANGAGDGRTRTIHKGLMVRDPVCGLHLPENRAIVATRGGKRHYFCSEQCREVFLRAS